MILLSRCLAKHNDFDLSQEQSKSQGRALWLHGSSAGELQVLITLFREICKLDPELIPFWSYTSHNGFQIISRHLAPTERPFAMKLTELSDLTIAGIIKKLNVQALALCEKDRFPHLLWPAFTANIPVIGIDTRLTADHSLKSFFDRDQLVHNFAHIFTSRQCDYQAALNLGLSDRLTLTTPPKVEVVLNYFYSTIDEHSIEPDMPEKIVVVGSVHKEETETIIKALALLLTETELKVRIYPKDVRKTAVVNSIKKIVEKFLPLNLVERVEVDTGFGNLFQGYRNCWAAIIGGSFYEKGGGHNFFEPLIWNRPTFLGPFTRNWYDEVAQCQAQGLLTVCSDYNKLAAKLKHLYHHYKTPDARKWLASRPQASHQYSEHIIHAMCTQR